MIKHKIRMFDRSIPTWLLVLTLLVAGAGAAVGTVLAGQITGEVPVTVGQALVTDYVNIPAGQVDQRFTSISDDGTGFTAAAEVDTGMDYTITVGIENNSDEDAVAELTLIYPDGLTLDVVGMGQITKVTRTGLYTWKMDVDAIAAGGVGASDIINITVAVADDIAPGFYQIDGTLKQAAY